MGTRNGRNVLRDVSNLTQGSNIGNEISNVRTFGGGGGPTLQKAVVVDVIIDINSLTDDYLNFLRDTVNNPRMVDVMPTNAVVARMVSDTQGQLPRTNTILFPLFSSHFMLPVIPGEIISVVYDDYMGSGNAIGYWLTRTSAERTIEDPNYTHLDRRFDPSFNPVNYSTSERNNRKTEQPLPEFPNGGSTAQTHTLAVSSSSDQPYERIIKNASAFLNVGQNIEGVESELPIPTPEPVPRWRKRPQEFVLQGANNTLICLGEDRKGSPYGALSEEQPDAKGQAGTIDIVAGRGRYPVSNPALGPNEQISDSDRSPTAPIITENARGFIETDKTPYRKLTGESRLKDNPIEGDPDFLSDAARLYISMQTEADVNFGLTNIEYTEDTNPIVQPNSGQNGTANKSYIVGKSDHIRFISRSDLQSDNSKGIDGTIAIIREGISEDPEDSLGLIYIDKTGIQIDAARINLGRGLADLAGAGNDPTPGGEPYIRWSKFRDTVKALQDEMKTLRDRLQEQIDTVAEELQNTRSALATAFLTSNCVPFSPDPALTSAATQLQIAGAGGKPSMTPVNLEPNKQQLTNEIENKQNDTSNQVEASKSTKIFGE
jgi:hypothetical protein